LPVTLRKYPTSVLLHGWYALVNSAIQAGGVVVVGSGVVGDGVVSVTGSVSGVLCGQTQFINPIVTPMDNKVSNIFVAI
jgi:hypothetical protein